ncbi:MAG: N-acetyl sugar amidotransferase [Desulfovibrio sp.]|nr:N-acetyl sugar amidotransferase [Desulfovibrio sp.]
MDTSDPQITFDADGHCNHCTQAAKLLSELPTDKEKALSLLIANIQGMGKDKPYDCIIGLSGGVDSSYLAYKAKDWNLRPLLVHVDSGWNTPESENNVVRLAEYLNAPLVRETADWEDMRDLQRAFLQSGVPNQDIPQDHLFFSVIYEQVRKHAIPCWLSGSNLAGESILPQAWGYNAMDSWHLREIHRKFGTRNLSSFKFMSLLDYLGYYCGFDESLQRFSPLNLLDYNPLEARETLKRDCGWQDYGRKHGESYFTRYFQNYYLPKRFGYDKRKAHLSSLIMSGAITRDQAIEELQRPLYVPEDLEKDETIVREKLGYSKAQWECILNLPTHPHEDYPSRHALITRISATSGIKRMFLVALFLLLRGDFSTLSKKISHKWRRRPLAGEGL